MFEKSGKYYADWRDTSGHRLRKSFSSKRAALLFEAEQKERAHPKQKARGTRLPMSSAPATRHQGRASTTPPSRVGSSQRLVLLHPKTSARRTSKK